MPDIDWTPVCGLEELENAKPQSFDVGPIPVVIVRVEDAVYALEDVCSHANIALSEGEVIDRSIECWLHGSLFDLQTGEPSGLPATDPVPVYAVQLKQNPAGALTISIATNATTGAPIEAKELQQS